MAPTDIMDLIQVKCLNGGMEGKTIWVEKQIAADLIASGAAERYVPSTSDRNTRIPVKCEVRESFTQHYSGPDWTCRTDWK
jgi:hypothetical protein